MLIQPLSQQKIIRTAPIVADHRMKELFYIGSSFLVDVEHFSGHHNAGNADD